MWKNSSQVRGSKTMEVGALLLTSLLGEWGQVWKTPCKRGCLGGLGRWVQRTPVWQCACPSVDVSPGQSEDGGVEQ